jgi:hypothetical protein
MKLYTPKFSNINYLVDWYEFNYYNYSVKLCIGSDGFIHESHVSFKGEEVPEAFITNINFWDFLVKLALKKGKI